MAISFTTSLYVMTASVMDSASVKRRSTPCRAGPPVLVVAVVSTDAHLLKRQHGVAAQVGGVSRLVAVEA